MRWSIALLILAFGCASAPRPAELLTVDESFGNQGRVAALEKLAPDSIAHARHYHQLAEKAYDDGEEELVTHYAVLAQMSFETALEQEKIENANRRTKDALEQKQAMQAQKSESLAKKEELEGRVTRMEKILALKNEEAKTASEKKKLEAELKKAREEHAKLLANAEAERAALEQEKAKGQAKLSVFEERNALLEEASKIPTSSAKQETRGVVITLHELFEPGKTNVSVSREHVLEEIAKLASKYQSYPIMVEGFTDSRGRAADNLALSTARAQAVVNQLISVGKVDVNRIRSAGYGAERPIADNSKADGRAKNRRIEVVFVFPSEP